MARKKSLVLPAQLQSSFTAYTALKEKVKGLGAKDLTPYVETIRPENKIEEEIQEREKLKNKAFAQDIALKKLTLITLFSFLAFETALIFIFTYLQAIHLLGFHLEEWSFRIVIAATITQITFMVRLAVKHLYPEK